MSTALPLANSVIGTARNAGGQSGASSQAAGQAASQAAAQAQQAAAQQAAAQQAAAELEYKRQQDAAAAQAAQAALEQKYREETAARQQQAQLAAEAEARQWAHDAELRRQEEEARRRSEEAATAAAAAARAKEMDNFRAGQDQTLSQLRASQDQAYGRQAADAQSQLAELTAAADAAEQRRLTALRQAVGRTRAGLGARGLSAQDGSGEAILLGLTNASETERKDAHATEQLKRGAIQQGLDETRRRNLLELSQLADRQRLEYLSKFF
ncbi:hypothetical protein [Azospirillum picis]|uniref:hypothetical protein n=1 Tax=Azospirillum picis TaxID=488438 RepID=UPI0027D7D866|nr:hypothetical protein [Azospirillum picis]MBP2301589.1 chemotaxis protein histidine kinase CheA [Azospirillum picis]